MAEMEVELVDTAEVGVVRTSSGCRRELGGWRLCPETDEEVADGRLAVPGITACRCLCKAACRAMRSCPVDAAILD